MLRIEGLEKNYGDKQVLQGISLEVAVGEVVGIVGPNGAGKTTLFKSMTGLVSTDAGSITVFQHSMPKEKKEILHLTGAVIEFPQFYEHLSGWDNLKLEMKARGEIDRAWMDDILDLFEVRGYLEKKVRAFSLGMRQRLALCRALLYRPKLLILDEPTNGLDVEGKNCLWKGLERLCRDREMIILVSSHSIEEIERHLDTIFFIRSGEIVSAIKKEELKRYYLLRLREMGDSTEALPEWGQLLKRTASGNALYKCTKEQLERIRQALSDSIDFRPWRLMDEYHLVMEEGEREWEIY